MILANEKYPNEGLKSFPISRPQPRVIILSLQLSAKFGKPNYNQAHVTKSMLPPKALSSYSLRLSPFLPPYAFIGSYVSSSTYIVSFICATIHAI